MENKTPKPLELNDIPENELLNFQMSITSKKIYEFLDQSIFLN